MKTNVKNVNIKCVLCLLKSDMIVIDASPLIALAKIGRLRLLKKVYREVAIGPVVKVEAVERGRDIKAPEVSQIELGIEEGWICEFKPTAREKKMVQRLLKSTRLDEGEAESLVLALCRKLMVVLDDKEARATAEAKGLKYIGTAGILLEAFMKGALSLDELEEAVRDLGGVLWLSPEVVAEILKKAKEVRG